MCLKRYVGYCTVSGSPAQKNPIAFVCLRLQYCALYLRLHIAVFETTWTVSPLGHFDFRVISYEFGDQDLLPDGLDSCIPHLNI